MKFKIAFFLFCTLLICLSASAQHYLKDTSVRMFLIGGVYSFQVPDADLAARFGSNSTIGASVWYKSGTNWLLGLEYNFMFGSTIHEKGILDSISTKSPDPDNRLLINAKGEYQILNIYQRGHLPFLKIGKIFSFSVPNPNSGIFIKAGAGFMQHKIKFQWPDQEPSQLAGEYIKGYDRFTSGLALSQSAGFMYFGNGNHINFSAELEIMEGFTKNRRAYNFDTMEKDDRQRLDLLYGIKFSWIFPIYSKPAKNFDFY